VLDVDDPTLTTPGQAGIMMYKTAADFDNFIAAPAPYFTIFRSDFSNHSREWRESGEWQAANGVFSQSYLEGNARALIGAPGVKDQIVRAKIRPIEYRAPQGTQERWSGLIARYTDDANYYYATLRSSHQLSLRKLVDGQIVELATQPYTVNLNQTYDVKLEAVGDQLRVHVNGQPRLQAHDFTHSHGAAGLMTWKTAAQFDDYVAYQP
jgi:pectate lyase